MPDLAKSSRFPNRADGNREAIAKLGIDR